MDGAVDNRRTSPRDHQAVLHLANASPNGLRIPALEPANAGTLSANPGKMPRRFLGTRAGTSSRSSMARRIKLRTSEKGGTCWIGLNDVSKEGEFVWLNNQKVSQ
ncbi:hypothetical protein PoB_003296100 [Plakobranchus ocellatus]|uniref:FHA domain-containing protein n=1 Tax=Plakobranchus ocellatus TaxID=259542 RepID=A0AAV4ADK5_9GAST|nr:hypothetical protein PoB_003296100 [Plakobranchus ocellatus]